MICYEDKLDAAMNATCPTVFGMERTGYLCLRSEIAPKVITGYTVDFVPRLIIPIWQPSENAYAPKSSSEGKNGYGLLKFDKSIDVFLVENTALTQEQIMRLENDEWVCVLTQNDGQNIVFGVERGLRLMTTSQELSSTETHGGIVLTLKENYVNTPMMFTSASTLAYFQNFDTIYGGTIATGATVKLEIDADKTGYIKLPNGTILTTVAGVINTTYTGVGGAITFYSPKTNTNEVVVDGVPVHGTINTNIYDLYIAGISQIVGVICSENTMSIKNPGNINQAVLIAPKATVVDITGCSIEAKYIGDVIYKAYSESRVNVNFKFGGGSNASMSSAVNPYFTATYGLSVFDVIDALIYTYGGVVTYNA